MEKTHISWCDHTQNFWIGCAKVSDGCRNCYAAVDTFARTQRAKGRELWGPKADRHRTSPANWRKPYAWNENAAWVECESCAWRGEFKDTVFAGEIRVCPSCKGNVVTTRQHVFVGSLMDICEDHPQITTDMRVDIVDTVETCKNLDWLWLTKRPENFNRLWLDLFGGKLPDNLWVGTTIENQKEADKRIPELMQINAKRRFLSCEPLIGHVDLFSAWTFHRQPLVKPSEIAEGIHWVIVGGESGPKARPMHPDWARNLRDQCSAAGIPFHFKHWGEWGTDPRAGHSTGCLVCNGEPMFKVGRRSSGRLLDGIEYNEFPNGR
jgi:protein gp37